MDTYKTVKKFTGAGFTEPQAEALTDVISEGHDLSKLATTDDVRVLAAELRHDMVQLLADMDRRLTHMEGQVSSLENRLTLKLGGMLVVAIGVVAALVKLL